MAASVTFDLISNARIETNGLSTRILRGVVVTGIDGLSTPDPDIIMQAQAAVTSAAGTTYPDRDDLFFVGVSLSGFTTNGVSGVAIYESFRGMAASSYIIRNTSYTVGVETDFIPGIRKRIKVGYHKDNITIDDDKVTMRFQLPARAISVSGLVYGAPTAGFDEKVGYVNDTNWGPPGKTALPKGYWMLIKYDDAVSKYSGYYTYEAVAATKNFEDWSECGTLINAQTGKHAPVDDADVTAATARDYQHGYIWGETVPEDSSGLVRIGGNPMTSFSAIFGF